MDLSLDDDVFGTLDQLSPLLAGGRFSLGPSSVPQPEVGVGWLLRLKLTTILSTLRTTVAAVEAPKTPSTLVACLSPHL